MHSYAGDLVAILEVDLKSAGWDGVIDPYPGQCPSQFAMAALRKSIIKKFHNNERSPDRDAKALAKFLEVNSECQRYVPAQPETTLEAIAFGEARDFIYRFFHKFNYDLGFDESITSLYKISEGVGFGPGANIGARSGDPYGKLAISRLTYTDSALLVLFQHIISGWKLWSEQELFRSQNYPTSEVQGSKLSFVPKSSEITRTICTEPILNMFFQKGIAALLERRLREVVGIDLSLQPDKNRELARRGSLTGEFGTIDLSSASDSMSMALVRDFFPANFVGWLERTRCKSTKLEDGTSIDLHMVSSMGNAYTFPLQTLFFTSLVIGAYKAYDINIVYPKGDAVGNFAVFGDDIIVRSEAYNLVTKMLRHCGFTVNHDKSFNEGLFRESCGSDWFSGRNVRGVYLQKLLDDLDFYSAYNRLMNWSVEHDVPLTQTLQWITTKVSKSLLVPLFEDDESGFKVPMFIARQSKRVRRNSRFQSLNYTIAQRKRCFVKLPFDESELNPAFLRKIRRKIPHWRYSPAGLLLLFLHGNIRDGRILLRDDGGSAEYRKRHCSCWDSTIPSKDPDTSYKQLMLERLLGKTASAVSERDGFAERFAFFSSLVWLTR